jgi:hypothetical protein
MPPWLTVRGDVGRLPQEDWSFLFIALKPRRPRYAAHEVRVVARHIPTKARGAFCGV